jgi:hypothetical protein
MYEIALKCYILKGRKSSDKEDVRKMKGVFVQLNDDIDLMSYKSCLESSVPVMGINRGFMMIESNPLKHIRRMVKYEQKKKVINGLALDKMIVFENHTCVPFLPNLTAEDYVVLKNYFFIAYTTLSVNKVFLVVYRKCHRKKFDAFKIPIIVLGVHRVYR